MAKANKPVTPRKALKLADPTVPQEVAEDFARHVDAALELRAKAKESVAEVLRAVVEVRPVASSTRSRSEGSRAR
jgi:hypothetical protein